MVSSHLFILAIWPLNSAPWSQSARPAKLPAGSLICGEAAGELSSKLGLKCEKMATVARWEVRECVAAGEAVVSDTRDASESDAKWTSRTSVNVITDSQCVGCIEPNMSICTGHICSVLY